MRWLLFLSRVALICNLFFAAFLVLRYTTIALPEGIKSFIIITGYPMSILMNVVVNIAVLVCKIATRPTNVPGWLILFNLFFFFVQIAFFIF